MLVWLFLAVGVAVIHPGYVQQCVRALPGSTYVREKLQGVLVG